MKLNLIFIIKIIEFFFMKFSALIKRVAQELFPCFKIKLLNQESCFQAYQGVF